MPGATDLCACGHAEIVHRLDAAQRGPCLMGACACRGFARRDRRVRADRDRRAAPGAACGEQMMRTVVREELEAWWKRVRDGT
jgi:hypothetical protein